MNKVSTLITTLALASVMALTGCATEAATTPDVAASQAPKPTEEPEQQPAVLNFGDVKTYTDGVSISVSEPVPFTPSSTASSSVDGETVLFTLVLTNNSKVVLEPYAYTTVASGGVEADVIFDLEQKVGDAPVTSILPGQTVKWVEGYSVADVNNLTLQTSPGFNYDDALFAYVQ